jgi:hydroxymethylglutaryl-CoA lyase
MNPSAAPETVERGDGATADPSAVVRIVEVGPRDGLQSEATLLPLADKQALIARLAATGLREIEVGAFVSAARVPQMADSAPLMRALRSGADTAASLHGLRLPVLTPNLEGYRAAVDAGADRVAVFASASETFSQRNINCSIAASLRRFEPVLAQARADGVPVRGYLSCVVGCPYEGAIAPSVVAALAAELQAMGCYEISLGDTIGVGTPATVLPMLEAVSRSVPVEALAGHFHDTRGMAVANVFAAYIYGLRVFDASIAGLGGCPYAPGASGNVATEDLVYLFDGNDIGKGGGKGGRQGVDGNGGKHAGAQRGKTTGIDLAALIECGEWICARLGRAYPRRLDKMGAARSVQGAADGNR